MKYFKYCASGNDFVIFADEEKKDRTKLAQILCDRYKGIGADGLIVIVPHKKYDFEWQFYNCDGSEANMCGNGSRAAAHFAHYFLKKHKYLNFITGAGLIKSHIEGDMVEIKLSDVKNIKEPFEYKQMQWQLCDTGVPHLVTFVDDLDDFNEQLCKELRLKYNANVNFAKVENDELLKVRTFERGVESETLACGTGMGACFYLAQLNHKVKSKITIQPKSGENLVFRLEEDQIFFKGKVKYCFEANYNFSC
ncbi:diaminopimelate epimerase [Campylobacter insulaenigrae]|uniref:Diaminopimelate epimerase n=1 Tax=Campylobacter insulaenigrae TaxID=260714 RepID=A0ABY3G723_9BACT|nr:diaminopimelate epimerase [Campylobacter insulaenigrae]MCR6572250.1 diaminopimelate epimerase [Campylobacter insulaenigrae]MCR6574007.1 diaminopimelate epimerase [Campylobacter insulaenigrae]MCR6576621.1 diaminopimelate epimerase [Campylobacter insulaenigrae]MCR6579608.1 diaminopimelate epimerase [Campylobacter insulaenigrae]MCR6581498.1 diaminopimelate epimerase [Campylobacter insulaenigrae]